MRQRRMSEAQSLESMQSLIAFTVRTPMLRLWREEFARRVIVQGVAVNAT